MREKFNPRVIVVLIGALTLLAAVVDLPSVPLSIHSGPIQFDTQVGGYNLDITLFGKHLYRDLSIRQGLDLQGGVRVVLAAQMGEIEEGRREEALEAARNIIERRVNFFGVSEPTIQTSRMGDQYRIIAELPGVTEMGEALDLIGQTAQLEFAEQDEAFDPETAGEGMLPFKPTGVGGQDLKRAWVEFDPSTNAPQISFELTEEGGAKFEELTTRLQGQPLAILLDGVPISAPTVQSPIRDRGRITGQFTVEEAKSLAIQLNAGALPVPIDILEQRQIGATLGQQSVRQSVVAGVVGLALVAFFMLFYYGKLGLLADIALLVYGLVTLALYKLIPVTLTLAGLAGFILSVGMAVDANILIFERIREELRSGPPATPGLPGGRGRPLRAALELGFGRAWNSIRDANICTLITCFVLFNPFDWSFLPSAGIVRGFALTLALGIGVGLFTGVVVTRNLVRVFYHD